MTLAFKVNRRVVATYAAKLEAHIHQQHPIVWLPGAYSGGGNGWRLEVLRARKILTEQIHAATELLDELDAMVEDDDPGASPRTIPRHSVSASPPPTHRKFREELAPLTLSGSESRPPTSTTTTSR